MRCDLWLTSYTHSLGHTTPSRPRPSTSYAKRRIAREDSGEDYTNELKPAPRDTPTDNVDDGHLQPIQLGDADSAEHCHDTGSFADEAHVDAVPGPGSQEKFDDDIMIYYHVVEPSLASQFLNLDDKPSACVDQMVAVGADPLLTSSGDLTGIAMGDVLEFEAEPSSLQLLDMKRFETVTDFDGSDKMVSWPWGDYQYRPSTPPGHIDYEEYVAEYELAEIEEFLREELSEIMVEHAIRLREQGMALRKEKREGKRVERGERQTGTIAFDNRVVHGRTIYNL